MFDMILVKLRRLITIESQEAASDPSRLLGKGVRGDPGRLLREEKSRKRIAKEKPKVRRSQIHDLTK